ncbi:hypothetical protein AWE51_21450 [Aquimarina aggregata]|uniref:Ig-like domain-containing protein n=1 Tax=Aquimarina aggregata TaxID=1642818 RepID=A0A163BN53_9FLAO|nr:hypothetical protein AWE51_21450 [Aquimarina aggregata]
MVFTQNVQAQTKGLIYDPAGTGQIVLDPDGNGYTSTSSLGFMSNDEAESEIAYTPLPSAGAFEPDSDLQPGPSCGFTDLVKSDNNHTIYTHFDGNQNLMFRFRLGGTANNSKGYTILIDVDQKFGFTGINADPNAVAGNPGFEIELVLLTNFGVGLYDVDGTTSPTEIGDATIDRPFDDFAQKSIAFSEICGDDDYFYDFYIPFADITAAFPGVTTGTPLRMVGTTIINPNEAIGNNGISDIGGIDDQAGIDDDLFEDLIDIFPPTDLDDINNGLPSRADCPTITGPLAVGSTAVSGTSTEVDGAAITVYRDGIAEVSTATVSGGTWSLSGLTPFVAGQVFTATALVTEAVATATGTTEKSESYDTCNLITVGATCSATPTTANIFCADTNRRIVVTGLPTGATIRFYNTVTGFVGDAVENGTTGDFAFSCNGNFNTSNCNQGGNCGTPLSGTYYFTVQESGNCESDPSPFICISGTSSSQIPTITATPILENTTVISGTLDATPSGTTTIILYINGIASSFTTTTIGTNWTISGISGLMNGDVISAFNQEVGECPQESGTVNVQTQSLTPIIEGEYCTSTGIINEISGISAESGATLNLYISATPPVTIGTPIGMTTVTANGSWTVGSISVPVGNFLAATVTNTGELESALSNEVEVLSQTTDAITVDATPLEEGDSSVSGTTTAPDGSIIQLYIDDTEITGFTALASGGLWTITGLDAVSAGFDVLYAGGVVGVTVQNGVLCESILVTGPTIVCRLPINQTFSATSTTVICEGETINFNISGTENLVIYELVDQAGNGIGPAALGDGSALNLTTFALSTSVTSVSVKAQKTGGILCETVLSPPINIIVNVLPEISLTSNSLEVCEGETSVDLEYLVAANGPPSNYSIDFEADANTAGFIDILEDTNFTSPITIAIPSSIPIGTYTGTFTIKNSNSIECESLPETFTIIVNGVSISSAVPTNPTTCGGVNGFITLSGLQSSTLYDDLNYEDDGVSVNHGSFTSDISGAYQITGLDAGSYTDIIVTLNGCDSNTVGPVIISDPGGAVITEGTHINPTNCITPDGTIVITGVVSGTYNVNFSFNGTPQPTQSLTASASGIQITSLGPGNYTNISISDATSCQSNTIPGPTTLVNLSGPTITLGTSPTVSSGVTTANLPYISITNTPDQYTLDYDEVANTAGFTDITTPTSLPISPIILTVPAGAPSGTYNGTITVINSSTSCISVPVPFTVTIDGTCTPPAAPSVTFNSNTYCIGDTITPPTATGTSLQWYSDATLTSLITTANPAAPTAVELGFDTVSTGVTMVYVTQTIGCESTATIVTLTVDALPIAATISSNTPVCSGEDAVFTISGTAGDIVTYTGAATGTATIGAGGTVDVTINGVTSDTTLNLTNVNNPTTGCDLPLSGVSETVIVDALPIAATISSNTPVCSGEDAVFTISGTAGDVVTYTGATTGTATIGAGGTLDVTVNGVTSDTTLNLTNVNNPTTGCDLPLSGVSETVIVDALPIVSTISSNTPVCSGEDAVFTISGTAGDIVTYSGAASGTATIGAGGTVDVTVNGVTSDTTLNLTNVNNPTTGCDLPLSGVSETVIVDALPIAATISSNTPVCSGEDAVFTISGTAGDVVTYTGAATGTATIGAGGTVDVTINGVTSDTTLNLTNVNNPTTGCDLPLSGVSETAIVNTLPTVTANASVTEVCSGESVTLSGGGAATYTWNNRVTDGVAFVPTITTTYTVTGIDSNGCENTAAITVTVNDLPLPATLIGNSPICFMEDAVFTIIGTTGDVVTYTGAENGTAIIGVDGTVDVTINSVTSDTTLNLTNVNNPTTGCDLTLSSLAETVSIVPFVDNDNDGVDDCIDPDPFDPCVPDVSNVCDTDGDGIPDQDEMNDDDNDGTPDNEEANNADPNAEDGVEVFNVVTPNGDGDHDVLVIRNIQNFPDNELKIFNRWGVVVYETKGYGINGRFFRGESNGRATVNTERQLPVGTYFYTLIYKVPTGETKKKSDYLYINR